MHVYTRPCTHVCTHVHTRDRLRAPHHIGTFPCTRLHKQHICTHFCAHVCNHICTHMPAPMSTPMRTHMSMHMSGCEQLGFGMLQLMIEPPSRQPYRLCHITIPCTRACTRACTHAYSHAYLHISTHAYTHARARMCTCARVRACRSVCLHR